MKKHIENTCDCLVVGGGTAGVIAAVQAARAGADTILIEMTNQLGGAITNGGVSAPAYFRAGGRQIVGGIGWEIAQECVELNNSKMPDFDNPSPRRPSFHVGLNASLYSLLAEEKCVDAGVTLCYQEIVTSVVRTRDVWEVQSVGNMLTRTVKAKTVVDCSGDATAVRLAGGECVKAEVRQPGTLEFRLGGYDCDDIDAEALERNYRAALAEGRLQPGDYCFPDRRLIEFLRSRGGNQQHIFGADSSDSEKQTDANIAGRQRLLRMLRFLREQPGLERCTVQFMTGMTAIRETWRIVGDSTITKEDYLTGACPADAVALTYYFIDIHHEEGIEQEFIPKGVFPTIPLGALLPRGVTNMLVAGRTICSDRAAFSAVRVEASCMAMGQAAGAAAALAAQLAVPVRQVPLGKLRALLREHGAVVPTPENG